jgi:two-component system chemotaxis response regulator CheY
MRKIIRAAADAMQMDVIDAQDGIEALEKLADNYEDICLVLLDWNMPGKSGYEVLTEIKGNETYESIPVMMVTTEGQQSNIISAIRAGAAHYLVKPFSIEELISRINECLGESVNGY